MAPGGVGNHNSSGSQPEEVTNMVETTSIEDGDALMGSRPLSTYNGLGVKVYMELVQAFCKVDRKAFERLVWEHSSLFTNDGNVGIVAQCQSELIRRQVFQLSRIYSTIPLEQLSAELELPTEQVQTLLLQISIDKVWAIQMEEGMVVFPKLTEQSTAEDGQDLEELVHLTKTVQKLDVNIAASSKYQAFVRRENNAKNSEGKGVPRGVEDV
jgi:hypothetical protein